MSKKLVIGCVFLLFLSVCSLERLRNSDPSKFKDRVKLDVPNPGLESLETENKNLLDSVAFWVLEAKRIDSINKLRHEKDTLIYYHADTNSTILELQRFFAREVESVVVLRPSTSVEIKKQPQ